MDIIREKHGIAVIEDDGDFFAVGLSRPDLQLTSLGADSPRGGKWFARFNRSGLDYVSHPRTRQAAMAAFRKHTADRE